jgi:Ser/Thr protein kinase RdoA (MazF antagonist)
VALSGYQTVAEVAAGFAVEGDLTAVEPFGAGHINNSFRLTYRTASGSGPGTKTHPKTPLPFGERQREGQGQPAISTLPQPLPEREGGNAIASSDRAAADEAPLRRFLLQQLNTAVFQRPAWVMENVQRVTSHIAQHLRARGLPNGHRRVLTLVPAKDGAPFARDARGGWWRLFHFIENARTVETHPTVAHVEAAGAAYAEFQRLLTDLPPPPLHTSIPHFHDTPLRYAALDRAIALDAAARAARARPEIDFVMNRRPLAGTLLELRRRGVCPVRTVHNDAKLSNVLLDIATDQALCVVDLDTVMPGLVLDDFGDMVRSMTTVAAEDESDLSKVTVDLGLFTALVRGYLSVARTFLNAIEVAHLVTAGELITLEQAVRFLTDYLAGDLYYKIARPDHNLARARAQLRLLASLERHDADLRSIVAAA